MRTQAPPPEVTDGAVAAGHPRPGPAFLRASGAVAACLLVAAWIQIFVGVDLRELLSAKTWREATRFLRELVGADGASVWSSAERWLLMGRLAANTVAMSVLAIVMAAAGGLVSVIAGARRSPAGTRRTPIARLLFVVVRGLYALTRAVPELIWAMLVIFVFTPGILPGAIALGLHNFGIVGKLYSEVVENLDPRPARALRTAGAGSGHVLAYSVLPQALPQFLTFTLYRWEVVIRTTIIVGFVGAGGLGREFRLAMSFFHYGEVAQLLFVYFLLVMAVDAVSAGLRRLAR